MFKNPFSLRGRITKNEYQLSMLFCMIANLTGLILLVKIELSLYYLLIIIGIPSIWCGLFQGIKRSHDLGNSGWKMLTSFSGYGMSLLFQDGQPGTNQYGPNPKDNKTTKREDLS